MKGEKQYDLVPDLNELQRQLSPPSSPKKKKKKVTVKLLNKENEWNYSTIDLYFSVKGSLDSTVNCTLKHERLMMHLQRN